MDPTQMLVVAILHFPISLEPRSHSTPRSMCVSNPCSVCEQSLLSLSLCVYVCVPECCNNGELTLIMNTPNILRVNDHLVLV